MKNIFEALRADHDRQRALIKTIKETSGDESIRRSQFTELLKELTAHADAEERSLYAAMLGEKTSQPLASHSIHEHHEIDGLIATLKDIEYSSPNWIRKFDELADKVIHHLDEEEHSVFQLAGKVLSESSKVTLESKFEHHKTLES